MDDKKTTMIIHLLYKEVDLEPTLLHTSRKHVTQHIETRHLIMLNFSKKRARTFFGFGLIDKYVYDLYQF